MKKYAYYLVFEGLADWQTALALCEINKHPAHTVLSVGFSKEPVRSMGGLCILPDIALDEVQVQDAAIFILPGGEMWETFVDEKLAELLHTLHAASVPLAAICSATLVLAKAGLLQGVEHTSNDITYLQKHVASYREESFYRHIGAVTSNNIITASGVANVAFAYEILKALSIFDESQSRAWLEFFS